MKNLLLFAFMGIYFASCSSIQAIVTFDEVQSEVSENVNAEKFKKSSKPSIVIMDEGGHYYELSKLLLEKGFDIRDKSVFAQIADHNDNYDYSQLAALTNTDYLINVVAFDDELEFTTNYYVDNKTKKNEVLQVGKFKAFGEAVEFKIIHLATNNLLGTYRYYITPCTDGCNYEVKGGVASMVSSFDKKTTNAVSRTREPFQSVEPFGEYERLYSLDVFVDYVTDLLIK